MAVVVVVLDVLALQHRLNIDQRSAALAAHRVLFCDSFDSSRARVMLQGEFVSNLSVCLSFCPPPPPPIPPVSLSSPLDRIQSEPPEFEHADGNKLQLASEAKVVEGLLQSTRS